MVFEEPTTWSGDGRWRNALDLARRAPRARARASVPPALRRAGRRAGTRRSSGPAPSGTERATSGTSSMPCVSSSEPPPMSKSRMLLGRPAVPAPHGEEGQVRLVFAGKHLEFDVGLAGDAIEHLFAVGGLADGRRREGEELVEAGLAGDRRCVADGGDDRRDALLADRAVGLEVPHESKHRLVGRHRDRPRPAMGIDHDEVHGVGSDVENTEAHTASVAVVVHNDATGTTVPLRSAVASRGAP